MNISVRQWQYVYTKDGRVMIIKSVIEEGKRYKGRDIYRKDAPEVEIEQSDICSAVDEICKNVTVD